MTYRGYQCRGPDVAVSPATSSCACRGNGRTCSDAAKKMRIRKEKRIRMGKMQSSSPPDSHNGLSLVFVRFHTYIKKKRGNLYLSLVPHFEAFALPIIVKRATQKPTPICVCLGMPSKTRKAHQGLVYTPRGHLPLLCFDDDSKVAKFRSVKNKTSSKRLSYICLPPYPSSFPYPMRARDSGVGDGAKV